MDQNRNGFDPAAIEAIAARLKERPGRDAHPARGPGPFRLRAARRRADIAHALNLSRAEVHGVVTFTTIFATRRRDAT